MKLGIIMDPIDAVNVRKDTTFAMMLEAQARDYQLFYIRPQDVWLQDGIVWGHTNAITVFDDEAHWYELGDVDAQPLVELDAVLMRKDPPFNMDYIYLTYLLEQAEQSGLVVVNKPQSLRDANEKLFTTWFPHCCPKTLVTSKKSLLKDFVFSEEDVVIKPLDGMGGGSVFHVHQQDKNANVIIETMTHNEKQLVIAQKFIPQITQGDKRIILVNGEPIPYALARVPAKDDFRGNLASGAIGEARELTDRDRWLCEQVGPTLKEKGLVFVGLDVIGDYLTEINVTSPTGVRELEAAFDINICAEFFNAVEAMVAG